MCGAREFGCAPRGALDSTRDPGVYDSDCATHGPGVYNSGCATRGSGVYDSGCATRGSGIPALPATLLMSPSGYTRATGTASTSAIAADEGCTDGTSDQTSSDDHAGEAGLPATNRYSQ
jgi:hypothetical protein